MDINADELFSQWNDQSNSDSGLGTNTAQLSPSSLSSAESKSIWKQIFSRPAKSKPVNDELKEQWSELDKDQSSSTHHRFSRPSPNVARTCPFYKKIPGKSKRCHPLSTKHESNASRHELLCGCIQFRCDRRNSGVLSLAFPLRSLRWIEQEVLRNALLQSGLSRDHPSFLSLEYSPILLDHLQFV